MGHYLILSFKMKLLILLGILLIIGCNENLNEFEIDVYKKTIVYPGSKMEIYPWNDIKNNYITLKKREDLILKDTLSFDSLNIYYELDSPVIFAKNCTYDIINYSVGGYKSFTITFYIDSNGRFKKINY